MSTYTPERWVILKLTEVGNGKTHYKVFAGWYGGFAGADSWKLSSNVLKVEDKGDFIEFYNESGSIYACNKHVEGMSGLMISMHEYWAKQEEGVINIERISIEQLTSALNL